MTGQQNPDNDLNNDCIKENITIRKIETKIKKYFYGIARDRTAQCEKELKKINNEKQRSIVETRGEIWNMDNTKLKQRKTILYIEKQRIAVKSRKKQTETAQEDRERQRDREELEKGEETKKRQKWTAENDTHEA